MPMSLGMGSSSAPTPIESKRSSQDDAPDEEVAESDQIDNSSSDDEPPRSKPRWGRRLFAVVVAGGLAVGGVALWPTFNDRFVQPVEEAAADLTDVQERTEELDSTSADLSTRVSDLENDLAALETETGDRLDAFEASLTNLDELVEAQSARLDQLDELASALGEDLDETNANAARQLDLTRAAELMSRARLFLFQANYGLAAGDLDSARTTLLSLDAEDVASGVDIDAVVDRLERAMTNLPDRPVSAASDLDIAWQELLQPEQPTVLPFRVDEAESTDEENGVEAEEGEDAGAEESDETEDTESEN